MEINPPLLDRDYLPSTSDSPPNSSATELFPDDPVSAHQRFGPPHLANWLPDSGATSHYTPVFSDLRDIERCSVPVSLADGSTKISTYKGTTDCYFTTSEGEKSILGLTDVYYVEGLSHRLLSLTAISGAQNFTVIIQNRETTIRFPNDSTFTWPLLRQELPSQQAFAAISYPEHSLPPSNNAPSPFTTEHEDDESHDTGTTHDPSSSAPTALPRPGTGLPLPRPPNISKSHGWISQQCLARPHPYTNN